MTDDTTHLHDWDEQELLYALSHAVDELAASHPEIRENFADIRSAMLKQLCEAEAIPEQTAANSAATPSSDIVRETLKALVSRPETQEVTARWTGRKPTDYVQSVDPLTGTLVLAGVYLVLTTSFNVRYRNGAKGKEVLVELRRKEGVPQSFMKSLIGWLRGGK